MRPKASASWTVLAVAVLVALAAAALAQDLAALSGTLKKVRDTGTLRLGYRESSLPFSYLNRIGQPIGYSVDLCREIAEEVAAELDGIDVKLAFVPVTSASRFDKVKSGEVDLECGSTTNNLQRQSEVAFSPTFFVAGTKLLVPRSSGVASYRDLTGKTVVATAGTTNETALRTLSDKQKLGIRIVTAADHAQSLALLVSGEADALANDDVLLYGFIAADGGRSDLKVVGEHLSYDPYGLVFRRGDPAFAALVERTFARLARERRLAGLYDKWFRHRLPTGERLNLPMSRELEGIFRMLGQP